MADRRKSKGLGMPTCRFCHGHCPTTDKGGFVQYGPRHYAHQLCYLRAGKSFDALTPEQQGEFSKLVLHRFGLDRKKD